MHVTAVHHNPGSIDPKHSRKGYTCIIKHYPHTLPFIHSPSYLSPVSAIVNTPRPFRLSSVRIKLGGRDVRHMPCIDRPISNHPHPTTPQSTHRSIDPFLPPTPLITHPINPPTSTTYSLTAPLPLVQVPVRPAAGPAPVAPPVDQLAHIDRILHCLAHGCWFGRAAVATMIGLGWV